MAREHARILVSVWEDRDFLDLTEAEQRAFFLLMSSPDMSWCGVLPWVPARFARLAKDSTPARIGRALDGLSKARFIIIDRDTEEVCVRSLVRRDGVLKQPNVLCGAIKAWGRVHSPIIREALREEFGRAYREGFPEGFPEGFGRAFAKSFPKGFPEGFANSPSPFPLPPKERAATSTLKRRVATARDRDDLSIGGQDQ